MLCLNGLIPRNGARALLMAVLLLAAILLSGCESLNDEAAAPASPFAGPVAIGEPTHSDIREASGMVESRTMPGHFWVHNDANNKQDNHLYLMAKDGTHKARLKLAPLENRDWEDIAIGPCPDSNQPCIFLGDIGDNHLNYEQKLIYRFAEPELALNNGPVDSTLHQGIDIISVVLADERRDAESLIVDPLTRDFYLITKRELNVLVYKVPFPQKTDAAIEVAPVLSLPYLNITAADISADGTELLVKDYSNVYYWKREDTSKEWTEIMQNQTPLELPYAQEPQGEAIAFGLQGSGYYTISEEDDNNREIIYFYKRLKE